MAQAKQTVRHLPLGPSGPNIDENNMVFFGSVGGYGPRVYMDLSAAPQRFLEPKVDLSSRTEKMKPHLGSSIQVGWINIAYSLTAHLTVIGVGFSLVTLLSGPSLLKYEEEIPVEVNFGFDLPNRAVSTNPGKIAESETDQAASKTEQQLPQLPKQIAVDSTLPQEQTLPPPEEAKPEVPSEKVPPPEKTETKKSEKKESPALVKETPPPGTKTLTPEELAKRIEKESRKVAKEEKKGSHKDEGEGRKQRPSDLPNSPFSDSKSLSDLPSAPSILPQGSKDGSLSTSAKSEYRSMVLNHIRRFWNLPDLGKFDPNLKTEIVVTVNVFGRILGKPRVQKKSGDSDFDEAAFKVVLDSVPFPELPKELAPRLELTMLFTPKDIKE